MITTGTKCAFCNMDAKTWHTPKPVNGKTMAAVPICGTKCNTKKEGKEK